MLLEYIRSYYFFILVFLLQCCFSLFFYFLWKKGYLKINQEKKSAHSIFSSKLFLFWLGPVLGVLGILLSFLMYYTGSIAFCLILIVVWSAGLIYSIVAKVKYTKR